jgi:hypothetical protein
VLDRSAQTNGVFTRNDFTFDRAADAYICPGGKALRRMTRRSDNGVLIYRASNTDCAGCSLKAQCTKAPSRVLSVNAHEEVRQHVASLAGTEAFAEREPRTTSTAKRGNQAAAEAFPNADFFFHRNSRNYESLRGGLRPRLCENALDDMIP